MGFHSGVLKLKQYFDYIEFRRVFVDYVQCFCFGSIAGSFLRTLLARDNARKIENALMEFSMFNRLSGTPWIVASPELHYSPRNLRKFVYERFLYNYSLHYSIS